MDASPSADAGDAGADEDAASDAEADANTGLPATCKNTIKDGDETDVDCGGGTCPKCGYMDRCKQHGDCAEGHCTGSGYCYKRPPYGSQDCSEPDSDGKSCPSGNSCTLGMCDFGSCRPMGGNWTALCYGPGAETCAGSCDPEIPYSCLPAPADTFCEGLDERGYYPGSCSGKGTGFSPEVCLRTY